MWQTVRIICHNCTFWSFRYLLQCLLIYICLVSRTEKRKATISLPLRRNADDVAVCLLHSRPKCITLCIFTNHHSHLYWIELSYYINTFKMWDEYYLEEKKRNLPQNWKSPIAAATANEAWNDWRCCQTYTAKVYSMCTGMKHKTMVNINRKQQCTK